MVKDCMVVSKCGIFDLVRDEFPKGCPDCGCKDLNIVVESSGTVNTDGETYDTDGFEVVQVDCTSCGKTLKE